MKSIERVNNSGMLRLKRTASKVALYRIFKKRAPKDNLTAEQKKQIREFYKPYGKVTTLYHNFYLTKTGDFSVEYIPSDLYINYVDKYLNNGKKALVFENKCYFPRLFPGVKQPKMVCCRMNGYWFNSDYEMLGRDFPEELLSQENEVVIKQAADSWGGHAVTFVDNKDQKIVENAKKCISGIKKDIIVQRVVQQHKAYAHLNESSLNSLRVVSYLDRSGEAKVYSIILRMGVSGMRVDNASSGGVNCGVREDGFLRKAGYSLTGVGYTVHPTSGVVFETVQLPYIDAVKKKACELQKTVPDFRLVSWDFSVDENGEPVLIEANLNSGGVNINQINNGPLFGEDTKKILDEVFGIA